MPNIYVEALFKPRFRSDNNERRPLFEAQDRRFTPED